MPIFSDVDGIIKDSLRRNNIDFNPPGFDSKEKTLVRKTHSRPMWIKSCGQLVTILTPTIIFYLSASVIRDVILFPSVIIARGRHRKKITGNRLQKKPGNHALNVLVKKSHLKKIEN